jgi:very-short-patch-repair endonuclease
MARKASIGQARALRRSSSSAERDLWRILRDRRLDGLKFRRQVPLGACIVDFLCPPSLVVEADGPFHDAERDATRDAWLAAQGFRVLRFTTATIGARPHEVISAIAEAIEVPWAGDF